MAKQSPIDLAYQYLKSLKADASFEEIWNKICQELKLDYDLSSDIVADLYSELVLDNRFALTSKGTWGLRDYLKFEDVKKQYDYVDKFETTEDFDELEALEIFGDEDHTTKDNLEKVNHELGNDKYKFDTSDFEDDDKDDDLEDEDFGIVEDEYEDEDE